MSLRPGSAVRAACALLAMAAVPFVVRAQISPGPLAKPHAELEGSLNCTKCHGTRSGAMNQACMSCHKEIPALVESGRGLHARNAKAACASCHPDHAGVDFSLVKWPDGSAERFDHRQAGWALEGKHADVKCASCHKTAFRTSPVAALSPRTHGAGWVGLETNCLSCHEDPHRKALGDKCLACHVMTGWKPASGFDHDSSSYPLTGKHADVPCAKCHTVARLAPRTSDKGALIPVFKPVSHKDCADCHADPHKGRLAGSCDKCHVTSSFQTINRKTFDHDATRYPLRGRHAAVACAGCHVGFPSQGMHPAFGSCNACHYDAHAGKATLAGRTVDCESCHTVDGYRPSTYTVAQHAKSAYPLDGKHAVVKCGACHTTRTVMVAGVSRKQIEMRPARAVCRDCHADDHAGQLASRADKGACEACHRTAGWKPTTYTTQAHASLKLALDGRHAEIPCSACHAAVRAGLPPLAAPERLGKAKVAFKVPETSCASCHVDAHGGRFSRADQVKLYATCAACHDTKHFRPSTYDAAAHAKSAFPLEGAHLAVPCVSCHTDMKGAAFKSTLVLAKAPATMTFAARHDGCAACHTDPHGDQFAKRRSSGGCESCHGLDAFVPAARFDHDRDASFPLTGAHAKVACASCHKPAPGASRASIDYRGLSPKCESCHTQPVRQ